ncbi:MAG TPA: DUF1833 domain-containing protein [Chromatiales bacterium]|nr:DUF1833 domain-containing protein [Chromatiales bacterium]
MPRNYSGPFQETINAVSASEAPLVLLEISHPGLTQPIRVVNDNQDLTHQGNVFTAMAFRFIPPDDLENGMPRAQVVMDNVGRELVTWLESSNGGEGATLRAIQVLRSNPDQIEWEATLDLSNLSIDQLQVRGTLGYEDILNLPGVMVRYRPETAPGLF